jgi:hypothetical protein
VITQVGIDSSQPFDYTAGVSRVVVMSLNSPLRRS